MSIYMNFSLVYIMMTIHSMYICHVPHIYVCLSEGVVSDCASQYKPFATICPTNDLPVRVLRLNSIGLAWQERALSYFRLYSYVVFREVIYSVMNMPG